MKFTWTLVDILQFSMYNVNLCGGCWYGLSMLCHVMWGMLKWAFESPLTAKESRNPYKSLGSARNPAHHRKQWKCVLCFEDIEVRARKCGNQCISARRSAHRFALKPCENHDSCVSRTRAQTPHAAEKQETLIKPMVPASIPSGSKGAHLDTFRIQVNP